MPILTTITKASGTVTAGTIANTETITVAGKVYTFQTTLTDVDGNVDIGADDDASIDNLVAAINLAAGSGTTYAASMTANPHVTAVADGASPNVMTVTANVPGTLGNLVALAEATTGATLSGAVLASGAGSMDVAMSELKSKAQLNSDVLAAIEEFLD